jgi:hypothetical protein
MQHGLLSSSELRSYTILSFNMFSYLFLHAIECTCSTGNTWFWIINSLPQLQNGVFRVLGSFRMNPDHLRLMTDRLRVMADRFEPTADRNSSTAIEACKATYQRYTNLLEYYHFPSVAKYFISTTSYPHISLGYAGLDSFGLHHYAPIFSSFLFDLVVVQYVVRTYSPRVAKHVIML